MGENKAGKSMSKMKRNQLHSVRIKLKDNGVYTKNYQKLLKAVKRLVESEENYQNYPEDESVYIPGYGYMCL